MLLVEQGLAESRHKAQALILAGNVFVGERRIEKAGDKLAEDVTLELRGLRMKYVSRGGLKMEGALEVFADLDAREKVVADFGASTGGFTDCVLQRGAEKVYAIDVGYGQLHPKLRSDARVIVMERTNARNLTSTDVPELVDWVVIDASFIGLCKLLPAALEILKLDGDIIALVKPQFEVGKANLEKGGVVRDETKRKEAIDGVSEEAKSLGLTEISRTDCSIRGPKGNLEAFLWLKKPLSRP